MLKIKDDVDMNIFVEEYGFKPLYNEETGEICKYIKPCEFCFGIIKKDTKIFKIFKNSTNWIIDNHNMNELNSLDTLYDLIQAGLIKKY